MALLEVVNQGLEALGITKMPPTPFVCARGVEAVWPKSQIPQSTDRLLEDTQRNHLTTRDLNLAETLFRHKYLTSYHLKALYFSEVVDKRFFPQKMEKLTNLRMVSWLSWKVNGKQAKTKVYCLDEGGGTLLEMYRQRDLDGWRTNHNVKRIEYIFRILMANDFYVKLVQLTRQLPEGEGIGAFEIEPVMKISESVRHQVTPTAKFSFSRKGKTVDFLLEVVRSTDIEYLPAKLRRYNDWYLTKNMKNPPVLFVIAEKDSQAIQIDKTLSALNLSELRKWCRYSTDLRLATEQLDQAFFKVKNGEISSVPVGIFSI